MATPTITGRIVLPNDSVFVGTFYFLRKSGPMFNNHSNVHLAPIPIQTNAQGQFSTKLQPGLYVVDCLRSKYRFPTFTQFTVKVPNSSDTILFEDLEVVGTQLPEPSDFGGPPAPPTTGTNFRESNGVRQLFNFDTGYYHSVFVDGTTGQFFFGENGTGSGDTNYRYRNGMLELADFYHGTWHAPYFDNDEIKLADDGATPMLVDSIVSGVWRLRDISNGRFRSWFISGSAGQEVLSFGDESL